MLVNNKNNIKNELLLLVKNKTSLKTEVTIALKYL